MYLKDFFSLSKSQALVKELVKEHNSFFRLSFQKFETRHAAGYCVIVSVDYGNNCVKDPFMGNLNIFFFFNEII